MVFMTLEEAKEIVRADRIGTYDLTKHGNRSRLGHAQILIAAHKKRIQHTDTKEDRCGVAMAGAEAGT